MKTKLFCLLLLVMLIMSASCSREIEWGNNGLLEEKDSDSTTIIITFEAPDRIEQITSDAVTETDTE